MNEETLSALLDGECSPAELDLLLRQMNLDPALRQRFARLALGQELRRGIRVPDIPADFADKVMAALPDRPDPSVATPTVVPLTRRLSWQPLAGLAAAAAVGAIGVLVVKPDPATTAPAAVPVAQVDPAPEAELADQDARHLRNYVMAYSQSRAQHGMGGTLGYARYAAYTGDDADGDR